MKKADSSSLISHTLRSDIIELALEFLPRSELKNTALVSKVWHAAAENTLSRPSVAVILAKWEAIIGPALYNEIASLYVKPTHKFQALKNLFNQVTDSVKHYKDDIINCLFEAIAEKPSYASLLVAIVVNEYPDTASYLIPSFNESPLNNDLTDEVKKFVINEALNEHGFDLQFAPAALRNNKAFMLLAVSENSKALQYASDILKNDNDVVLAALNQNDLALKYASPELKNNSKFVLAAVSKNSKAFKYASAILKKDKAFVLDAISQNSRALKYAAATLKNDKEVVLTAINKNAKAFLLASMALQKDSDIRIAAGRASLIDYARIYTRIMKNKLRLFPSQCKDFITVKNPEAWQAARYGLLLGIAVGFCAGVVSSLIIAGAVISAPWCLGLLGGCMLTGAVMGATVGSLIDRRLSTQSPDMTQEEENPLAATPNYAKKIVELEEQRNSSEYYHYKAFFKAAKNVKSGKSVKPLNFAGSDNVQSSIPTPWFI